MKKYVEDLNFSGEEYICEWTPWSLRISAGKNVCSKRHD